MHGGGGGGVRACARVRVRGACACVCALVAITEARVRSSLEWFDLDVSDMLVLGTSHNTNMSQPYGLAALLVGLNRRRALCCLYSLCALLFARA